MSSASCPIPAHVPPHLIRDVDTYNIEGGKEEPFCAWARVQKDAPDVYFTPHYGGYWVLNRAELITEAFPDHEHFSSKRGAVLPELPPEVPPFPPLQIDPPEHSSFRQPYNIALSPARLGALAARAREVVIERIESFVARGECDFMNEVATHVPVAIVMQVFDMPFEDRVRLLPFVDVMVHSGDLAERGAATQSVMAYAAEYVTKRQQNPGNDLISTLLKTKIGERDITVQEVISMVTLLLLGGLDSVTHTMGFIMRFLAGSPEHRRQLAENPALIPDALEELLRRHSISSTTRTLTEDRVVGGVQMKAGDRIMLEICLHGLDEKAWDKPLEVDFNRRPRDIMSFGKGIHKCVGASLARAELRALLEEWFKRIPDFSIKPGDKPAMMTGQNIGITYLPLVWPAA